METKEILSVQSAKPETFHEFEEAIIREGFIPTDRGNGHWQVRTKLCVINYYPWSSNKTIYAPAVQNFLATPLRYQGAETATVVKLVQEIKEKEKKYASNNNAEKRSNLVRENGQQPG